MLSWSITSLAASLGYSKRETCLLKNCSLNFQASDPFFSLSALALRGAEAISVSIFYDVAHQTSHVFASSPFPPKLLVPRFIALMFSVRSTQWLSVIRSPHSFFSLLFFASKEAASSTTQTWEKREERKKRKALYMWMVFCQDFLLHLLLLGRWLFCTLVLRRLKLEPLSGKAMVN